MKKIGTKGMTSIELLVAFVVVAVIVTSLFDVILNYKNKQQVEAIKNSVLVYTNTLQKVIQDDLVMGHLTSVSDISANSKSATFTFSSPNVYSTYLSLDTTAQTIFYGHTEELLRYPLPELDDLVLTDQSSIRLIGSSNSFLKIDLVFSHPNFSDEKYTVTITAPVNYS